MSDEERNIAGYNGLTRVEPTLPSEFYFDGDHYERELRKIWYRNWLYVCRASELRGPRAFRVFEIGSQEILILRDQNEELRAFHNTCRHRGSVLVREPKGRLPGSKITCPYHCWAYDLQGKLQRTPTPSEQGDFDKADYSLYDVAVRDWNGFVFIHLEPENARPLEESFNGSHLLDNWPLADLALGHTYEKILHCNWKVFWENFNECLHCPSVHKELSEVVPLYKQHLMEVQDDPEWEAHQRSGDKRYKQGLAEGKETWSKNGSACAAYFPDLNEEEIARGHTYCETVPSGFIVGHVDYVRVLRLRPLGPETTEIHVQWFFREESLADPAFDASGVVEFGQRVIDEDGAVSEINQKGLRSIRHKHGALMAEEYAVHDFHVWVLEQLG
jgi:Rieske 2Fe-2S family protein